MRVVRLYPVIIACCCAFQAEAQFFLGLRSSQFGGVTNVDYNPAIADNPLVLDINLIAVAATVNNNYVGLSRMTIWHPSLFSNPEFQNNYLRERVNGLPKDAYAGLQIQGPLSFMYSFGKKSNKNKNAIAFTYHVNALFDADHVNQTFARIIYYGVGPKADTVTHFLRTQLSASNMSVKSAVWNDYGVTYSRVVYEKAVHLVKVGGTLKLLQPLAGAYMNVPYFNYKWPGYDTLSVFKTQVSYNYSQGLITSQGYSAQTIKSDLIRYINNVMGYKYAVPTLATDLGAVYEWRPDEKNTRETACPGEEKPYGKTLYKLAVGFSIMDFGAMRFERGQYSESFIANIQNWDVRNAVYTQGLQSIDDTIRARFKLLQSSSRYFTVWLPTRFNLYLDYNIAPGFGLNGSAMISPDMSPGGNMLHQVSTFALTPKYDVLWVGVYFPLSVDVMGNISWGATIRLGPLIIGTQDLLGLFVKKYIYNADIHAAIKIPIPYAIAHKKGRPLDKMGCYFGFAG